ncbi:MAG: hypothetical protein M3Q06_08345, partial [Bacteroidota bacterium]|nr:hypothetical protein [Bacteroidota bacterium]
MFQNKKPLQCRGFFYVRSEEIKRSDIGICWRQQVVTHERHHCKLAPIAYGTTVVNRYTANTNNST